jgi:hypothetical protein
MVVETKLIAAGIIHPNILSKTAPLGTIYKTKTCMKGVLLIVFLLGTYNLFSQDFSAKDFLFASSLSTKKFESYLSKKKFISTGKRWQNDTVVNIYSFKREKKKRKKEDSVQIKRSIELFQAKDNLSFTFLTSVKDEFTESIQGLSEMGFFCGNKTDTAAVLYQKRNISVLADMIKTEEGDTLYSLTFSQAELPSPESIHFADDLLQFYSHEYLVGVFGEKNVVKDLYYFSDKEIAKCSVLFPKTSRQAIFIWEDEMNLCKPSSVIVGGGTKTAGSANYDGLIGENVWQLKDGVYPGMSINSLMNLNGESFKFYGKNTNLPYTILNDNAGALNFKKNRVQLGCLNPTGSKLLNNPTVNADEILSDNLGLYVLMIMVFPQTK